MIAAIEKGKLNGVIRPDVMPKCYFVCDVRVLGHPKFGKLENSKSIYLPYLKELKSYLDSLR
jgi:hypothetical protein